MKKKKRKKKKKKKKKKQKKKNKTKKKKQYKREKRSSSKGCFFLYNNINLKPKTQFKTTYSDTVFDQSPLLSFTRTRICFCPALPKTYRTLLRVELNL